MNKSDLRNLIKNTIEEILKERTINVADKKDVPKDLEDDDVVNISKNLKKSQTLQQKSSNDKTQSDKLKNVGDRFKSKPVKMTKDFYS